MDYGEVLTKAWQIIWKYKILWIFGILAGCGRAASGGSGGGRGNFNFQNSQDLPREFAQPFEQMQRFVSNIPVWVWIILALALLVLLVITVLLNTIGRIGLIRGANLADESAPSLSFGELFSGSLRYFWRIFFLNLLIGVVFLVVILMLVGVLVAFSVITLGIGLLCLVPFICLLIPISWFINVVVEQSNIAIITEDLGIIAGIQRAWEIVTKNIGPYIVMALILFIGGGIMSFIVALPVILILLPAILGAGSLAAGGSRILGAGIVISVIIFLIYLPILLLASGIIQAYITSAWTLTFRRLTGRGAILPIPSTTITPIIPPTNPEPFGP